MIKKILFLFALTVFSLSANSQIYSNTAAGSGPTHYTSVSFVDSVFYYCTPISNAELTALPPSGTPNWTFTWQKFDLATNSWLPYSVTTNAGSSTITGLTIGGYRVTIVDATMTIVGCYRAWIVEVLTPTTVDVDPIPPGCGAVQLNGHIDWGTATPYYEPPAEPLVIDANTEITVCFQANHTYVSDLGFYLVSPSSCGSVSIPLSPNPGSIGQGATCNSGNNIGSGQDLCFTTEPAPNLDVCAAPAPLNGTYDSYGAANIPINWNPIFGCDASQPGWAVQIYDCIGADVGALTYASITFTGTTMCGDTVTINYDSGPINSVINDNSCTPGTASIYVVPVTPATVVAYDTNFVWTANPNIFIPGATTDLTPLVNPGPTVTTVFTLSVDTSGNNACIPACCGGNWQDSETYVYIPPVPALLFGPDTLCTDDAAANFIANVPGGMWSGTGITNPATGLFDPSVSGAGVFTLSYMVNNPCPVISIINVVVIQGQTPVINPAGFCEDDGPANLTADIPGGIWSGAGITDSINGTFDPSVVGVGSYVITYTLLGTCDGSASITVNVTTQTGPPPSASLLNTASNGSGGVVPGGSNDLNWEISTNNISGPYVPAVVMSSIPGSYYASPWPDAGWISHSATGSHSVNTDYYYKIYLTLPCFNDCGQSYSSDSTYCLSLDFFTDNSVNEIYVNGIAQSPIQPLIPVANQYFNVGFNQAGGLTITLCHDWQPGINELIVKVSSGPGFEGFLAQYSSSVPQMDDPTITAPVNGTDTVFCVTETSAVFTGASTGGTWSADCGTCIDPVTGDFDPSQAGAGNYYIYYETNSDCPAMDSIFVTVNDTLDATISTPIAMCQDAAPFNLTAATSGGTWSGTGITNTTNGTFDPSVSGAGSFTITYTVGTTCPNSSTTTVVVNALPNVNAGNDQSICPNDTAQLNATGAQSYIWNNGSTLTSTTISNPQAFPSSTTTYTVTGTAANGCVNSDNVTITITNINAAMSANPTSGIIPLDVTISNNSSNGVVYYWNFGNGTTDTTFNLNDVMVTYTTPGTYTVTLTAVNANGCVDVTTLTIVVLPDCAVWVPNVFSPNGDGQNDVFEVFCSSILETMNVKIFNRWGIQVGEITTPGAVWDGADYSEGTYYYVLIGTGTDNTPYNLSGHVTLIR